MSDINDQVKKIVVDHLGIDEAKVVPEAKFIDDLGADSLDTVELVMAFEEKFGIEIPDDAEKQSKQFKMLLISLKVKNNLLIYLFLDEKVVITGIGLLTTIGDNQTTAWNNLINGKSGVKKITQFDVSDLPCKIAGYISNNPSDDDYFNKSSQIDSKDIKEMIGLYSMV